MAVSYPPLFEREEVGGVKVVKDEVLASGLSGYHGRLIPMHGTRVLTLEDGTVTYGCRECEFTGSRGDVKAHRGEEHGVAVGGGGRRDNAVPDGRVPNPSSEALSMTVYEVLQLAELSGDWEEVLSKLEARVAELTEDVNEERRLRRVAENRIKTGKNWLDKGRLDKVAAILGED